MVINTIDFPNEIIRALNEDSLVVFAGAGISMNEPTKLPDFNGLVENIGKLCGVPFDSEKCKPDEFLGDRVRDGVAVHKHVAEVLDLEGLRPNEYHKNILRLFNKQETVRIVTTNQDVMIEAAAEEEGLSITCFYSPAIPSGDNFEGIVHLHGVVKDPGNIIITDSDFGRAYMLNGYATRFLVDMFKTYTVLFIGYSYKDPIVRYLTASIPGDMLSKAYILTPECDLSIINRTGIKVILYPKGEHLLACNAIEKLGSYCKRGLFAWEKRINTLDLDQPPFDQETIDEILDGLNKPPVRRRIMKKIHSNEWAAFLNEKGIFDDLFNASVDLNESSAEWGKWLADNCLNNAIFDLILYHNNTINPRFCEIIISCFSVNDEMHSNELLIKYMILFKAVSTSGGYTYNLIDILCERGLFSEAWGVLINALNYRIVIEQGFIFSEGDQALDYKEEWLFEKSLIDYYWDHYFHKKVENASHTVAFLTNIIHRLYLELSPLKGADRLFSLDFFDLEKTIWINSGSELHIVCEIIIAALIQLSDESPEDAIYWLKKALLRDQPSLVRRLGLLGLREIRCLSSSEKTMLVLDNFHLHEISEKEQLFKLIAVCFDEINSDLQQTVLERIWNIDESIAELRDDRSQYRIRCNWYNWIQEKCESCRVQISDYLKKIHDVYPNLIPSEHPELDIGPIQTKWGSESPVSQGALHEMPIDERYDYLNNYKTEDIFDGPDRFGLMSTLTTVCSNDLKWGLELIEKLSIEKNYKIDIWDASIRGLAKAVKQVPDFQRVLEVVETLDAPELAKTFAQLVETILQNNELYDSIVEEPIIRNRIVVFLEKLWLQRSIEERFEADWPTISLNTVSGIVTDSLVKLTCYVKHRRIDQAFKSFVSNSELRVMEAPEFACVVCEYAAQINYCDKEWFSDNVLVLLESENPELKKAAWEGFLLGVRNFSPEFAEAMLPIFHKNRKIREKLEEDAYRRFIFDYVLLFTYLVDDPVADYVMPLIVTDDDKEQFADALGKIMKNMDSEQTEALWNRWVKQYWLLRLKNIPSPINTFELSKMIHWAFVIPAVGEVVDLIIRTKVDGFIKSNSILYELREENTLIKYPEEMARLLIYIYNHCDKKNISVYSFNGIAKQIIDQGVRDELKESLEELI